MGLKKTSETVAISFRAVESAPGTFTENEIDLTLSPLDNEVFVVVAVDLDPTAPAVVTGQRTTSNATVTKSTQTSYQDLRNSNTIAIASRHIETSATDSPVGFTHTSLDTPVADVPYIDIIATNNFFVGILGDNNPFPMSVTGRLWGYRAKADASTYAALVQSEVLSA